MKIGIITWHNMQNFGSMLQVYALQTVLIKKKHKVNIIDYRNIENINFFTKMINSTKFTKTIRYYVANKEWRHFLKFQNKYLKLTKPVISKSDLLRIGKKYDCFICGSDQIWSPNVFDKTYFLDFVPNNKIRIAYSPSVVIDDYNNSQANIIKEELRKFRAISVREEKGKKIIQKISNNDKIQVNLDPTMLLTKKEWDRLTRKIDIDRPYILVYMLTYNEEKYAKIKQIAKERNCILVNIGEEEENFADINLKIGPIEFLSYIKNATLICTDSYHGTLFAIKFEKEFYVFERFKSNDKICQNDRIYEILTKLDLQGRIVIRDKINLLEKIDYRKINNLLENHIKKSLKFIDDNIDEEI